MENKDWLNDLKVGDKVFVVSNWAGGSVSLSTVSKITPTRQIVVNGMRFKDGKCRTSQWHSFYLEEATSDRIRECKEKSFIRKVIKGLQGVKEISYEQAKVIAKVFGWDIPTE